MKKMTLNVTYMNFAYALNEVKHMFNVHEYLMKKHNLK